MAPKLFHHFITFTYYFSSYTLFALILQWLSTDFLRFWRAVREAVYVVPKVLKRNERYEVMSRETHEAVLVTTKGIIAMCSVLFEAGYQRIHLRNIDNDSIEV